MSLSVPICRNVIRLVFILTGYMLYTCKLYRVSESVVPVARLLARSFRLVRFRTAFSRVRRKVLMMASVASVAMKAAKDVIRQEIRKTLRSMPLQEKRIQSQIITEKILKHERFLGSHRVSVFLNTQNEVSTENIIRKLFEMGKLCFIPKYDPNSRHMDMVKLNSMEDYESLPLTSWHIKQPAPEDDMREEALSGGGLDLMIMPGLAFTKTGYRLGQGKGYYDYYLDRCLQDPHGRPYIVGLCFREQLLPNIPVEDHDCMVDEVLYPD